MKNKIISFIKNQKYSIPILLLLIGVLSYGILIPTLGLYWDGWPYMWQYHVFGSSGFPQFVASDRPHSAWIFMLTTWLFGYKLIAYHIASLFFHWISAIFVWWSINIIWPKKRLPNALIAISFIIYPGFLQQPISIPYLHHISHMALFFFSIWGMLFSLQNSIKYWWLIGICVFVSVLVNFSLEYFTPLELLRPILIWFVFNKKTDKVAKRIIRVAKSWVPYFCGLLFFLIWRVLIFKFPTYSPKLMDEFTSISNGNIGNSILILFKNLYTVSISAWSKTFHFPTIGEFGTSATILYFVLLIFVIIIIFVFFRIFHEESTRLESNDLVKTDHYAMQLIIIGLFSIFLSGIMYWVLKLPVSLEFAWDRLNLSFVFGVSLLMVGLMEWLLRLPWLKLLTASLLISLAVGFHFQNTMSFKRDWENFQDFFWQLSWRAPDLKKGTVIMTTNFPLNYYSDNSLTAPLNWTYDTENKTAKLNFLFYFTDVRLKSQRLTSLLKNQTIQQPYRSFSFEGNTNNALVLKFAPPGCLQILDPIFANAGILPNLTQLEADSIQISNLDQIISNPPFLKNPPSELLPNEPNHDWCYYFEKADLARQSGDWQTIINLGMDAKNRSLKPRNPSEWLPFIEANIRLEKIEEATSLANLSLQTSDKYLPGLCYTWDRIMNDPMVAEKTRNALISLKAEYNCPRL
jgi:hypothetical protein